MSSDPIGAAAAIVTALMHDDTASASDILMAETELEGGELATIEVVVALATIVRMLLNAIAATSGIPVETVWQAQSQMLSEILANEDGDD